jgi:hypothetical protein
MLKVFAVQNCRWDKGAPRFPDEMCVTLTVRSGSRTIHPRIAATLNGSREGVYCRILRLLLFLKSSGQLRSATSTTYPERRRVSPIIPQHG